MTTRDDNPKVFISYSWSSPQHEKFVLDLAEKLMADGVHVLLDKWDLKEGQDKYNFMEKMVTDSTVIKVLIISDQKYATKADSRVGGVGTETQIISNEVYQKVDQEKFIPIVTQFESGLPCLPTFLKARIYINFADDSLFSDEYEKLLRNIFNKPSNKKPMIGKAPAYLFEENPIKLETASIFANLKDAIEKEKKSSNRLIKEFLQQLFDSLSAMRIIDNTDLDQKVVDSISAFQPYRNQFVEFIQLICDYELIMQNKNEIFAFFEKTLSLNKPTKEMDRYNELWFDNFKFINYELFLYFITILIKSKKLECIDFFLNEEYLINSFNVETKRFIAFNSYIKVLEENRKYRLQINRFSVTADIFHDAANIKEVLFEDIMQTDFILCLRSVLALHKDGLRWFPRILALRPCHYGQGFELFLRAKTIENFKIIKQLLVVNSKAELIKKFDKAEKEYDLQNWKFGYDSIPFKRFMNLDNLYEG